MTRFFGIYFAGIVEGEDVVSGGEAMEAALGGGDGVDGRASGVEEEGQDFGGDRLAGGVGTDEVEDGVVVEVGVLGGAQGGEGPGEESLPGDLVLRPVEAQEFAKGRGAASGVDAVGTGWGRGCWTWS
jgi:hypothetical protein